ncbi:MAG: hypothetical protein NTW87_04320 [Planctomycetota bacterium]|nr:hypothetical protein [Planctomycetota bacterium]
MSYTGEFMKVRWNGLASEQTRQFLGRWSLPVVRGEASATVHAATRWYV